MKSAGHVRPVLERAVGAFVREFGARPRWGAAAPGRVNLIGEHTDYNEGFVLPMAIDRVCVAVGGPGAERGRSRVVGVEVGERAQSDVPVGLGGVRRGSWESYVFGVMGVWPGGAPAMDVVVASSVPLGAGLSSSASVEVAVATLVEEAMGVRVDPAEKARVCQRAEHEFAGVPCGIMDQMASVMGRAGHAMLIDCRSEEVRFVRLPRDVSVVVVNSNVRHSLASGEYAARRAVCGRAAGRLGVRSLREATMEMVGGLEGEEQRCVRHIVSEIARTMEAARVMEGAAPGGAERLGVLMAESHASLRDDYRVSCAELDFLVGAAMGCEGVFGARMTGGGFGGCIVAAVRKGAEPAMVARVSAEYERGMGKRCACFVVAAAEGASALDLSGA